MSARRLQSTRDEKKAPFIFLDPSRLPVFLWLPNLIGYVRVATLLAAMLASDPTSEFALNMLVASFALDYFDGPAARKFNMCSQFGDLLDHVTDHVTMTWLVWLTSKSPYNVNFYISVAANAVAILYMLYYGHYFKHAEKANFVQRLIEDNNFWNLPSLLWAANTIIIPGAHWRTLARPQFLSPHALLPCSRSPAVIKLSFHAKFSDLAGGAKASTPLLDAVDALGACVTVSYTVACIL
jgi:CDP-diacylglycerol--inositol 3-phosphatidyltransferase